MRIGIERRAREGELFAPDAFTDQIGRDIPLDLYGESYGMATLIEVEVREGGRVAGLALDAPDTPELRAVLAAGK